MEQNTGLLFLSFAFRIVGAVVCYRQAKWLNRDAGGWGVLGFFFPLIAMIWVFCLSPKSVKRSEINTTPKPFTKYYTENGVIEVENSGERKVTLNGVPAPDGQYELNRFETIEVFGGKVKQL